MLNRIRGAAALAAVAVMLLAALQAPLAAQNTGTVTGTVVDRDGTPVPGVLVQVVGLNLSAAASEQGTFRLDSVVAGSQILQVSSDMAGQASQRIVVTAGGVTEVVLRLSPLFHLDELVISAGPLAARADELFQSATALSGNELRSRIQASLGETLSGQPGISSTYFGPGASRPVIRGLGGDRVRVLESGLGSGDASNTSPDHAVSLDPSTADRIEVVRGPATLLYGSSAIGGVVNVLDGRVPFEHTDGAVDGQIVSSGGTVADELSLAGDLNFGLGPFVARLSGSWRETDDYAIPGFAELDHDDEGHDEGEHEDEVEGILENSAVENSSWGAGLSWVGSNGYIGAAFTGFDNLYGVPGGHGHEDEGGAPPAMEEEEEFVSIDLRQRRFDAEGEFRFNEGLLERIRLRLGNADYEHVELEGDEVGTRFENDQWEGRVELRHRSVGPFDGAIGFQFMNRDFSAVGDEAFTPPNQTDLLAAFVYEEIDAGAVRFQLGSRFETQTSTDDLNNFEEDFSGLSFSGGINWDATEPVSIALALSRSVKLPTAEELFSNGPHLATNSFEIGNRDLTEEVATSADLTFHLHTNSLRGQVTGFVTDFSDYIFPAFTGNEVDELEEVIFSQADARFIGLEAQASWEFLEIGSNHLSLETMGDLVRATLDTNDEPLPRIPAASLGAGLRWEGAPWTGSFMVRKVTEQDRVAAFEESTPGYTMVNAEVGYRTFWGGLAHQFVLQARNLTDADARNHVSLLKEVAPMPGRDLRILYRVGF